MNGTAYKTTYGAVKPKGDALTKSHLKYNKNGRIVSKSKSSKKGKLLAQLRRAGYTTQKGKFGAVKIEDVKKLKKSSKKKSSKKKSSKKKSSKKKSSKKRGGNYRRKRTLRGGDSCTGVPGHEHP